MKVMSLNIWGGKIQEPLLQLIQDHSSVDVFCLQEVYHAASLHISTEENPGYTLDIFSKIQEHLPSHTGYFQPIVGEAYGIGMFINQSLKVLEEGALLIHENPLYEGRGPSHSRKLQWIKLQRKDGFSCAILNVHGLWNGRGKTDSPERISQSQKIQAFVAEMDVPVVLCGDFNLRPDTQSVKLLEKELENLVSRYQIPSTRTSLYPKDEPFADYIFTSPSLAVEQFQVLKREVSDHAPLLLELVVN